ncbi:reprolysin-like metallopeptidase [Hymenobacter canadensis]|uniref:M12 family metallo-peptidase n=1 Tax=Hymenobacter canadensis TaxID=2999067 RepID=A0ABY7LXY4_9BACT|nr:zinc-dependent metalloprotease family protein [Hymenobacter canadensis]WBA43808.1 M12 family metallo-peptidase [Hymenobacter canadensis]
MKYRYWSASLLLAFLFPASAAQAQSATDPLWQEVAAPPARGPLAAPARWYSLDTARLARRLALAPPETRPEQAVTLEIPYPDGQLHRFAVTQVPVMAPALAARYPRIRTYAARSLDDPGTTARLEWTPVGLHAQVLGPAGTVSVLADADTPGRYQSRPDEIPEFDCRALPVPGEAQRPAGGTPPAAPAPYGGQLRTLRVAMAATGEYVQRLGGGTVQATLASMVTLVSSMNAVYERDLALRLQLVANTDQLIFLDAATDPYDNASPRALMDTNRTVVDNAIGSASYDLGHVLGYRSNGYSGVAYVGVVCLSSEGYKAGGSSTGSSASSIATVTTHEIGHQLGSGHTFNGDQGNCGGGNRSATLAYEPGAGNTIMSYDSRCAPDNVGGAIRFFHAGSLSAILPRLTCGTLSATGNRPPAVSVPPAAYTIPLGTPFTLAGTGTDPDGDALAYSWEQLDRGTSSSLASAATDASGPPLFRSFAPVASPARTFPTLSAVLSNSASLGEILPLVARTLNFRLTARDNRGGVAAANFSMNVADAGPFRVTAANTAATVAPGSLYTITWDVLGTDQAPVSCAAVRILFSNDGGQTFPTELLANTPNNGTATVRLPTGTTTQGRLKIEAIGNVFFDVSDANLTLSGPVAPLPVVLSSFTAEARANAAELTWTTASEQNNRGFAVEASTNSTDFRQIGWVAGRGSSAAPTTYRFADPRLPAYGSSTVYYRLRQTDLDGTETFSPVRVLSAPTNLAATLQVWPNPAHDRLTVAGLTAGQPVQLLDLSGRVLLTATAPAGPLELQLPAGLAPGVYLVRSGGQAQRLLVQ